jgi:hypothetical protein
MHACQCGYVTLAQSRPAWLAGSLAKPCNAIVQQQYTTRDEHVFAETEERVPASGAPSSTNMATANGRSQTRIMRKAVLRNQLAAFMMCSDLN